MTVPKRRRFRFGLRTMFVVVTVFACWLGYQVNWIRQRHALIDRNVALIVEFGEDSTAARLLTTGGRWKRAPGILPLLGEQGVSDLIVTVLVDGEARAIDHSDLDKLMHEAAQLFPEAEVKGRFELK